MKGSDGIKPEDEFAPVATELDKAREMALEQELVELRTILQAQVEQMEAQQAANGAAEAAPAPAPPAQGAPRDDLPHPLAGL